ncbi:MAG: flap endonuclease-1 [Methanobacteriota archaeon]
MGVDVGELVPKHPITMKDLAGKVVAIDGNNILYQFLASIRQPDGTPLMDAQGRVTSHLNGLFYRTANLIEAGVKPIYVFDGEPHPLKLQTIRERSERKKKAEVERQAALAAGDTEKALTKAQQTSRLTRDMIGEARGLLAALGIPAIVAPQEGEGQAAAMARSGAAYATVSQDYDALLFGTPRLVRHLTTTGRRKVPGKQVWIDIAPEIVDLAEVLAALALSREQLVDLAILCGTDYNPGGIRGIGPKRALKLVKEHGAVEKAVAAIGQPVPEDLDEMRKIFLAPAVLPGDPPLSWKGPDEAEAVRILCAEHAFAEDRVRTTLLRYAALREAAKQRRLDFF